MKLPDGRGPLETPPRRSVGLVAISIGAVALAAAALLALQRRPSESLSARQSALAARAPELAVTPKAQPAPGKEEVTFSALQQAVLNQLAKGSDSSPSSVPDDPQRYLLAALDQRLANAPSDPAESARLRAELRPLLDPALLDGAAATLVCGSSMCRIDISGADEPHAQKASNLVAERLPKTFAAAAVYAKGTGERAIYAAKDGAGLRPADVADVHSGASAQQVSASK